MTEHHQPAALVDGLGTRWETLALGFKPYATAGAIHPALALLDAIMTERKLKAGDIAKIHVECTTHCRNHVAWPYVPQGVASAQMNIFYALSVMALERAAMVAQFDEARLEDPAILEFMRRITVTTYAAFDAMGNACRYATRVTVADARGDRHTKETLHRPGSPEAPLSGTQLAGKFDQLAARVLDAEACRRIQAAVQGLDSLPGLAPLIAGLRV